MKPSCKPIGFCRLDFAPWRRIKRRLLTKFWCPRRVNCTTNLPRLQVQKKKKLILDLPESSRRTELIDIGHLVQEAVQTKNEETARTLMDELFPLACASKRNKNLGDAMVLNASFLVRKEQVPHFDNAVQTLDARYGGDLQFKYVGPVPPFNFVVIVIQWKEEELKNVSIG